MTPKTPSSDKADDAKRPDEAYYFLEPQGQVEVRAATMYAGTPDVLDFDRALLCHGLDKPLFERVARHVDLERFRIGSSLEHGSAETERW